MMEVETIRAFFGWCAVINLGLILWWFLFLVFAGDWVFRMHSRFFQITREQFNAIHYAGLAMFKVAVFILNVVPYVVLWIMD